MERVKGIEPSYEAWEAAVLPLNYTRAGGDSRGVTVGDAMARRVLMVAALPAGRQQTGATTMKSCAAEFFGTFWLVLGDCGSTQRSGRLDFSLRWK